MSIYQPGEWTSITLTVTPSIALYNSKQPLVTQMEQRFGMRTHIIDLSKPLETKHGKKIILVKLRGRMGQDDSQDLLMYDGDQCFAGIWKRPSEPETFEKIYGILNERRSTNMGQLFLWARKADGYKFEICMNKLPPQDNPW